MGLTDNYTWPMPELSDPPDGPAQFKALAVPIDAQVKKVDDAATRFGTLLAHVKQALDPPMNQAGVTVDFTAAQFPPAVFVAPPSGRVRVTLAADVQNNNTATSTVYLRVRSAANYTFSGYDYLCTFGGRMAAARSFIWEGLTAGATYTLIPQWQISSGSSATAYIHYGDISVQALN